ncbi:MAG: hypothetical protein ACRCUY_10155 [Thermoguttaceae bacterium]
MNIEKEVNRILFWRRTLLACGVILIVPSLIYIIYLIVLSFQGISFEPPDFSNLNPNSETYWKDRTIQTIKQANGNEFYLNFLTAQNFNDARQLVSVTDRLTAISEIAITLAEQNQSINIDDVTRTLEESSLTPSLQGRIAISQALMYLRIGNEPAARVAFQDYYRLLIEKDLKLDSTINDLAFIGAVTLLGVMKDSNRLIDLFKKQDDFTIRVDSGLRMKSYRVLAGEEARVGLTLDALQTAKKIEDPIELCRAFQSIIALTARPIHMEPTEPFLQQIQTSGPWTLIAQPSLVKRVIDDVLQHIASIEDVDDQIKVLTRLAGSKLVCDPEIHQMLLVSIEANKDLDDLIKRPAIQLLKEPESDLIRQSLAMPPRQKKTKRNIDPAEDDWTSSQETISIDLSDIDPNLLKSLFTLQKVRAWNMIVQSYLVSGRPMDAIPVLKQSAKVAQSQTVSAERFRNLLAIGQWQIQTGDFAAAQKTLQEALLDTPSETSRTNELANKETDYRPSDENLSELARLQVAGRFFDDAKTTINRISSPKIRDADFTFLFQDLIQIGDFIAAKELLNNFSTDSIKNTLRHSLLLEMSYFNSGADTNKQFEKLTTELAGELGEKLSTDDFRAAAYSALNIPSPDSVQNDAQRVRSIDSLMRRGLLTAAASFVDQLASKEMRARYLLRLSRENALHFRAYRDENDSNEVVRLRLIQKTIPLLAEIDDPEKRGHAQVLFLNDILTFLKREYIIIKNKTADKNDDNNDDKNAIKSSNHKKSILQNEIDAAFESVRKIPANSPLKTQLFCELVLLRLRAEHDERTDREIAAHPRSAPTAEMVRIYKKLVDEGVQLVNEIPPVPERGFALVALSKVLMQIGHRQYASLLIDEVIVMAQELADIDSAISILLALVPVSQQNSETEKTKRIFTSAAHLVSESFLRRDDDADATFAWRLRDSGLDRIVRKQIEWNLLEDAVLLADRIKENVLRDRLLRAAAYIALNQQKQDFAETVARRITANDVRLMLLRDMRALKRDAENSSQIPSETSKP